MSSVVTAAMSNLCRDESCLVLEDKIESVFGSCFSTHGLGGVLTCGVIGIKAGLSHSPIVGVSVGKHRTRPGSHPQPGQKQRKQHKNSTATRHHVAFTLQPAGLSVSCTLH